MVREALTSSSFHRRGIKVQMVDGQVGPLSTGKMKTAFSAPRAAMRPHKAPSQSALIKNRARTRSISHASDRLARTQAK
ncbi:MAG: DUF2196 domain-containing protein [Syntrophobacteraceae bacterium]